MVKNTKVFGLGLAFLIVLSVLAIVPIASANTDLQVNYLRIDGEKLDTTTTAGALTLEVKRGEALPIRVRVSALNNDVKDVQVSAGIYGYQYSQYEQNKIYAISNAFDLDLGDTRNIDLNLEVPTNMDSQDMKLRIMVADRDSVAYVVEYELDIKGIENSDAIAIKDAYLSPSNTVMAGRAVSALVKVKNIGSKDFDDGAILTVRVPALNIQDTESLDKLDADEAETFEKIILRVPANTVPGDYLVEYTVKFDEYESVTKTGVLTVTPCEAVACGATTEDDSKTLIQVPSSQVVYQGGAESVFPLMINNMGDSAKAYTIAVSGVDAWGTSRVDPGSSIIIPAKSTATVFLYVAANEGVEAGEKYFKVAVGTEGDMKEIPLSANVQASENTDASNDWSGLKKTLEVALIILVIILILIGLIVGFNKLRGSDNDDEDAKTFY